MAAQVAAAAGGEAVGASLNVVGLEANVTDSQLYDLFSQIGEVVSVKVCRDLSCGLLTRYGHVSYRNPKCAQRALEELNFTSLNGKPITITCSHLEARTSRSGDGSVYIKNLENEINHKALPENILSFENTELCNPDASSQSMGYGSVQFSDEDSVQKGMTEHNDMLSKGKQVSTGPSLSKPIIELSADKASFTNVFVKNFCESTTEDDLNNIFGEFGLITSTLVLKNKGGTSKCCGMVNFENSEDAARAVESLNGQIFGEKKWYVGRAQNKSERQLELKHHLECVKEAFDNGSNIYVKNLDHSIGDEKLKEVFSVFGLVTSCRVLRDEKGNSTGRAFVSFSSPKEASDALSGMNGKVLVDKPLYTVIAQRKEDRRVSLQNFGKEIDHKPLPETFSSSGDIHSIEEAKDVSGHSKGYGFVQFTGVTGEKAIGELDSIVGKFNGVITKLNGIIGELNGTVQELNGLLLNGKQVDMGCSHTKEIDLLVDKANFTNVLVKNFCESTTEEDLKKIFSEFGLVTDTVVMRNEDGTSKCFGFVNFKNAEDAARAVESFDSQIFEKKKWYSGRAQNKLERELELKNTFEQCVKKAVDNKEFNLYVKNLDYDIGDEKLKELFSSFGLVTLCKVNKDRKGRSKRSGFVAFSSPEEASKALSEMNGKILFGKPLYVALARRKEDQIARLQNLDKEIDHKALPETFSSFLNAGSYRVVTDASDQSMGFGSMHSSEEAIREQNGMLLNGKQVYAGSSHNEKERRLLLDKPEFTNVFIKNFCKSTTEDDLKKIFGKFGLVTSTAIMRNEDKTSKCFGYVNFENAEDAARAVESLNGEIFNKKTWYVGIERKSFKRELTLNHQFKPCVNVEVDKGSNLSVENLDYSIGHGKLSEVFSPFRSLKSNEVMRDRNGLSMGSGFSALSPPEQASESLSEKNSNVLSYKLLYVAHAQRKENRRAWLQGHPGFGYEKLLFPGVRPARPLMHSMSVPLFQKDPRPAPAMKQQKLRSGRGYHCLPGSMFSVRYENGCCLLLCDVGISQSIPVGALASSIANALPVNRGRHWMKFCTRLLSNCHLKR
ncbi:binding protein 2 [Perilla frutescens var. hirtella]|uniref:Binding protein 2 n=1 Tax=Perilla frutescens var. hirtella TaxID=608512 RepID=A0AAD4P4U8_PERFH|nr:binding protein 2 [Perilla frutescens var. hirtella]